MEVEINAGSDRAGRALVGEINEWWLPDFQVALPDSALLFEPQPDAGLIDGRRDGAGLLWYAICRTRLAERAIYLARHITRDWGAPTCIHLEVRLVAHGNASRILVTDSHAGHIGTPNMAGLREGWTVFPDGLKIYIEREASPIA